MATRNEQFFIDLGKGASWAAGVAFQRSNPLPLDKYSVFETEAKAIEYASTSAVAYPGQVVAYIDGDKMAVCVLAETADGSSLELQAIGGAIGDYDTAAPNTLPQKKAIYDDEGAVVGYEVKWLPVSAIVEGDGNTTYTFAKKANDDKTLVITPYDEGVAGEATEISFAYLTANEVDGAIDAKVGVPVNGEEAATGLYALLDAEIARAKEAEEALDAKIGAASTETTEASGVYAAIEAAEEALTEAIANALEEAKQYADDNDANDNTTYAISYGEYEIDGTTKKAIKLAGSDNSATYVDVADFLKDGMVDTVSLSDDGKSLVIVWNTDAGKETTEIPLEGFIDVYTAGNGIDITGRVVSAKLDTTTENFLTVGENGIKLAGVQEAINTAKQGAIDTAAGDATSKANQAKADAIADAEGKLATAVETINDTIEETVETLNGAIDLKANTADVYTSDDIDAKVEALEAATALVQTNLDEFEEFQNGSNGKNKWFDDEILRLQNEKANSVDVYTKAETYTKQEVNEEITKGTAGLVTNGTFALLLGQVEGNSAAISTNTENIGSLQGTVSSQGERIGALETLTNDYATVKGNAADAVSRVSAVETRLDNAEGKIGGLETLTGTHTSDIAALKAKDTALDGDIAGINITLGTKANASDLNNYYTKSEVGTIAEGKTLVKMIEEAGDKSALEARVKANEDAIVGINEDIADINEAIEAIDYVDEDELAAAIKVETDRAVAEEERLAGLIGDNAAAIAENAKNIAGNTAAINSILGNEDETDLNSIAELAKWIEDHGEEAAGMAEAIEANTAAIGVNAEGVAANKAATEANATAIKTINETTIPAAITEAKEYADDQIEALNMASYKVKDVDGTTLQVSETGVASIKAVSSDLWAQGTEEIIFNGGGAVI